MDAIKSHHGSVLALKKAVQMVSLSGNGKAIESNLLPLILLHSNPSVLNSLLWLTYSFCFHCKQKYKDFQPLPNTKFYGLPCTEN